MSDVRVTSLFTDGARVIEIQERMVGPRRALTTVVGEVDHFTHALFQSALARTWETRPVAVAVDLRQVTFLNAGGLRTLLLASGTARVRGVPLALQAEPGQVTRLLTMAGLREQLLSPGEVRAVLETGSSVPRPVLRMVTPTDIADDSGSPLAAAPVTGGTSRGGLRSVRAPDPAPSAGDPAVARHGFGSASPLAGRDGAATVEAVIALAALTDRGADDARPSGETVTPRGAPGPAAALRRARLHRALRSRELVGRATGMLMQRDSITADQALDALTDASKKRNQSIVVVAEGLTGTRDS